MTQQVGVEGERETQNVPAAAAGDVGEQPDCGSEPWAEGLSQGQTRKSTKFLLRGLESLCRAASGQLDGASQGRDQVWVAMSTVFFTRP